MLPLDPARHIVTAVVVTHDGARWLPETLEAVRGQSRPVQRVVGADTGSRDRSGEILAEYIASDAITKLPRRTGYGDAIRAAVELPRANVEFPGAASDAVEWIWLVHDDCTPDPDALQHLLLAADDDPHAAVLGPKLRDWFDRRMLVEVGVTIDGAGRRETGLEPREFDHGQHDGNRRVLSVSSAGMLVRRDVWDALGGFDRRLPLFRDDIDFCWRAGGAGHRVLIVTDAVAYHAEAAARRRRHLSATSDHPRRIDRRHALFVLLVNLPFGGMVGALLRNSFASALRVLTYAIVKQPANAFDEAAAITSVYLTPGRLIAGRFRRRRQRRRTYSAIRPFMARGVALRQFTDAVSNIASGAPASDTAGRHQAVTTPPPAEDDDPLRDDQSLVVRVLSKPGALLVLALTVVALVAERSLLIGERLAGGALPPVIGGASDLWSIYLASWHDIGIGTGAAAPPYVGLLALLSTVTFGKPWLAVTIILVGCVPLAGLTAYLLAKRVLHYGPAQIWMAGSYALLPMATGAVAQGRVGTALVHAMLPVLGLLVLRILTLPPRRSRRAAWTMALLLSIAAAFVPLVWLLALVVGVLVAVAFGHVGRRLYISIGIVLVAPLLLLLPWSLSLFRHPSLWLLEAGLHQPGATPASAGQLLMLSPGGPGTPPIWVTAGFIGAALCALLLLRRRMLVSIGWSIALFGILVAIVIGHMAVAPPYGGPTAPTWPGVALAFAATALLLSAATAAQSFGLMVRMGGLRRMFALAVAVLALTTPVSAAAVWMWNGAQGPLEGDAGPAMPGYLRSLSDDGSGVRTLVISPERDGSVTYSVLRGREPRVGEEQVPPEGQSHEALSQAVAGLVGGASGDEADVLAQFGIGYVLLPEPDIGDNADLTMVDTMDGTPGMARLLLSPEFAMWRLDEDTGRLRVADSDGAPTVLRETDHEAGTAEVPPGSGQRTLLLAEPSDGNWRATLDGTELEPTEAGAGLQAFELPAKGGDLEIERTGLIRQAWLITQAVLLAMAVVLALPGMRTEDDVREEEEQPTPRPRNPIGARRARGSARGTRRETRGHRRRRGRRKGGSS
ncbi:GT2 family glycosyltransferase [Lipingzhangella halophila]|uniref:GT2 family glycosyltransferase n=1 Tax=Lipingzhangella halophila TaxID=1783352 RepID=A0A7W7RKZ0_9ACTN|nr:glycosyltransferase family 2 protein [Lipingzhangella halophila]MBB4933909.1 GT2 family glycosyltransferase [Lipingzhangella halophila]